MTVQQIVDLLNEAFEIDPVCIDALLQMGSPCNDELANHPTIQVRCKNHEGQFPILGLLGVLNGIAGFDDQRIVALYGTESHCLKGFAIANEEQLKQMTASS